MTVEEFASHFKAFSVGRKIAEDLALPPPHTPLGSLKHGEPEVRGDSTTSPFLGRFTSFSRSSLICGVPLLSVHLF